MMIISLDSHFIMLENEITWSSILVVLHKLNLLFQERLFVM